MEIWLIFQNSVIYVTSELGTEKDLMSRLLDDGLTA
jgi:hypothetical protein